MVASSPAIVSARAATPEETSQPSKPIAPAMAVNRLLFILPPCPLGRRPAESGALPTLRTTLLSVQSDSQGVVFGSCSNGCLRVFSTSLLGVAAASRRTLGRAWTSGSYALV